MSLQKVVPPPEEVRLNRARAELELVWPDGQIKRVTCLALRQACACSACSQAGYRSEPVVIDPAVTVDHIEPVGVSGLQFFFSDGHSRGHYPWRYLRELGARQ